MNVSRALPFWVRHLVALTPQYKELAALRQDVQRAAVALRGQLGPEVVDEIAIPSYTHPNRLMRYLFWERLAVALEWLDGLNPRPSCVMDFGCGMGVLFPALRRRGLRVLGCDIHPEVAAAGAGLLGVRDVEVVDVREGFAAFADGSVEVIVALDVLEHVGDVESLAFEFRRLLGAQGRLLCSLPTENVLYRMGRRLAGFSGAYHVHDPAGVVTDLRSCLKTKHVGRLYPFLPLFDFFEAHR